MRSDLRVAVGCLSLSVALTFLPDKRDFSLPSVAKCLLIGWYSGSLYEPLLLEVFTLQYKMSWSDFCCDFALKIKKTELITPVLFLSIITQTAGVEKNEWTCKASFCSSNLYQKFSPGAHVICMTMKTTELFFSPKLVLLHQYPSPDWMIPQVLPLYLG